MSTIVITPSTVTVIGPNTGTTNQAPVAPATPANPQPATPAPAAPTPNPAPVVGGPTTFVAQQTVDGSNRYFPNWVIGLIIAILLLLLAYGGYILYQSGKDAAPASAPTPTVKVINTGGGSKTAIDPEARVSAAEANAKADLILQERENEKRIEAEAKEKNKESEKPDCSNNLADWLKF